MAPERSRSPVSTEDLAFVTTVAPKATQDAKRAQNGRASARLTAAVPNRIPGKPLKP